MIVNSFFWGGETVWFINLGSLVVHFGIIVNVFFFGNSIVDVRQLFHLNYPVVENFGLLLVSDCINFLLNLHNIFHKISQDL